MRRDAQRSISAGRLRGTRSGHLYLQGSSAACALDTLAAPKVFDSLVRFLSSLTRHM
jgi:hypothetical protein